MSPQGGEGQKQRPLLFLAEVAPPKAGDVELHSRGSDVLSGVITKTAPELEGQIQDLLGEMNSFFEGASSKIMSGFELESREFSLVLNAEGKFISVAKAGVEGGIRLTWKRLKAAV